MEQKPHVVGRVGSLLRALAPHEPHGANTSTLARSAGLPRPTAHRLLMTLMTEGFVDRHQASGLWTLGPELYLLGAAAAERYDVTEIARPSVHRLAEETGESAFFSARRGAETVCLIREDGSFPIRSFVLYEGIRFPLGVASAGLVMLAYLPEKETEAYLSEVDLTASYGACHAVPEVRSRLQATRTEGYSLNPGLIVEGSWGMGAAVFDSTGTPRWALSLTGIESRFTAGRRPRLGKLLLQEAHRLAQRIQHSTTARAWE